MVELQICLLGSFQVCRDFAPLPATVWRNPLAFKLLKLILVMRPDGVPADILSSMKGFEVADPVRLPGLVDEIRRVLEPQATVVLEQGRIHFRPGAQCWLDLDAMLAHYRAGVAAAARGEMFPAILAFQEADALYQGDLLEESQEPWLVKSRRDVQEVYTDTLDRLAEGHAVLARYQDAVGFCHKALSHDPLREATYQRMMVYYYYLGDMSGAAEAYQACREALAAAGRRVSADTDELWGQLSRCELPSAPGAKAAPARAPW